MTFEGLEPAREGALAGQGLTLRWVEWGRPDAPILLLVHGGRDHARSWDAVAAAFAGEWRVVAPDLRGHGRSDWPSDHGYDMWDFVYDLHALVDHLGAAPATIVAHSLGGNVALRYAALFPTQVARLVSIEGLSPAPKEGDVALTPPERLREWVATRQVALGRRPRPYPSLAAAAERMHRFNPRLTPELALHLTRHGSTTHADGTVTFRYDPAMVGGDGPVDLSWDEKLALWGEITAPVLLIYGTESWFTTPDRDGRLAALPTASLEVVEGAGHWVQHDRLDRVVALVRAFIGTPAPD